MQSNCGDFLISASHAAKGIFDVDTVTYLESGAQRDALPPVRQACQVQTEGICPPAATLQLRNNIRLFNTSMGYRFTMSLMPA